MMGKRIIKVQFVRIWEFEVKANNREEARAIIDSHMQEEDYSESYSEYRFGKNVSTDIMELPETDRPKMYYEEGYEGE